MQHIHPYFGDDQPRILDEETYKDVMAAISPGDLPHRDYSHLIKYVKYEGYKASVMKFFVPNKYNGWESFIQWKEWNEQVEDSNISPVEAARLLLWGGNMRVHCTCPAYHYWGSQYIDTQLDMAIVPEDRFPSIRNPQLAGIVCKHLNRVMKVLPFHLGDMAQAIKQQRAKKGIEYIKPAL